MRCEIAENNMFVQKKLDETSDLIKSQQTVTLRIEKNIDEIKQEIPEIKKDTQSICKK